jgi:hypothetical protein
MQHTMNGGGGNSTEFLYRWRKGGTPETLPKKFTTGVSLHSHTWHSHESLAFLPNAIQKMYFLPVLLRWAERRYKKAWKGDFDYSKGYWTSPVPPAAARALEAGQIENLGLRTLVSLTDHDTLTAHAAAPELSNDPISFEWTAPYKKAVFHIGVHNLPPADAPRAFESMQAYTNDASHHDDDTLGNILMEVAALPGTLIVFNHPLSDQGRIGFEIHESRVKEFLAKHHRALHALEANALQPWDMNRRVATMAAQADLPVIAGGDRHGFEPNGAVNLTNAATFEEFADEIRKEKRSTVLFMSQTKRSLALRYAENVKVVMSDYPELTGRWSWHDRVFYHCPDGITRSFSEMIGRSAALGAMDLAMGALGVATYAIRPLTPIFRESNREIDA